MSTLTTGLVWLQISMAPGLTLQEQLPFEDATMEQCETLADAARLADSDDPDLSLKHARAGHCYRLALPPRMPCRAGKAGSATDAAVEVNALVVHHLSKGGRHVRRGVLEEARQTSRELATQCERRDDHEAAQRERVLQDHEPDQPKGNSPRASHLEMPWPGLRESHSRGAD